MIWPERHIDQSSICLKCTNKYASYQNTSIRQHLLQYLIVPDTERYQSPEADTALVYPIGNHDYHDPIMHMVCSTLEENWEDNPNDSVIAWMRLNISLLRTDPHRNLMQNLDVAGASEGDANVL